MREIDNNINNAQFQNIQKISTSAPVEETTEPAKEVEQKEIKDLSSMSATVGKSQVSSDSTENDMQIFAKYPQEVEQMNKIFDNFRQQGHSYEEATQLMDAYRNEFINK